LDWINLLIYWNIEKWKDAILALDTYDTYGCNFYKNDNVNPDHYSGNFFWVSSEHLKKLNTIIGPKYNDPEFWLFNTLSYNYFEIYNSKINHYELPYPSYLYK